MRFFREAGQCSRVTVSCLWLFVCFAMASGCARTAKPPTPPVQPFPVTAESLVALLEERSAAIRTLKAQFSIQATGTAVKGTQRMEAALIYQRPNLIRLRAFARMGFPVFDLFMADGQYEVRIPMQGKSLKGSVAELDRQQGLATPIILGLQASLGHLTGAPVLETDHIALREEDGFHVLDIIPADLRDVGPRRFWFDPHSLEVARQDFLSESGEIQASIVFEDYRAVGSATPSINRPYRVLAEDSHGRTKLVLNFREIVPNADLTGQDWGTMTGEPAAVPEMPKREG